MKVAIVHDYLTQRGGAERVALALHRMFPRAPIYTSVYDPDGTFPEFRRARVVTSYLQRLPHRGNLFRAYLLLYADSFRRLRVDGYDLVVSSSSGWAHGVATAADRHVCYCHNPARWLYQTDEYLAGGALVPAWARPLLTPTLARLRRWDRVAATRPTAYVANSRVVAHRIERCYGRRARVVHPPVDVGRFERTGTRPGRTDGHYLSVARLLPYKRVDLAVRVCTATGRPLVVVGDGPARASLEKLAGPTVRLVGRVDDATLRELYGGARGLIQCGEEDFGIAPLEANAAGVPVAALGRGGALETVVDGRTGALFDEQSTGSLAGALDRLESARWDADALRDHACAFSEARFADRFGQELSRAVA